MESSRQAEPIVNIVGEKIALGPYRHDLLPLYTRWINDFDVARTLSVRLGPLTAEQEEECYERANRSDTVINFTIYERSTMRPIGNTSFHNVDHLHRTAEFGILIGEKECWNKGYGTETTMLALRYGFTYLHLHSIMLHVHACNERAIRVYRKAGFRDAGRIRECHALDGKLHDVLIMDCLSTEFDAQVV